MREREEDCTTRGIQKTRTTGSVATPSSACEGQKRVGDDLLCAGCKHCKIKVQTVRLLRDMSAV